MGSKITVKKVSVTTAGSSGSATGSADCEAVNGFYLGAYLDFHASAPATTDTTISAQAPAHGTIQVISNSATDGYRPALVNALDAAGAAISGVYSNYPVSGSVRVALAGCDALTDAVTAYLYFLEG